MNHNMIRLAQWSPGDGVIITAYCGVTVVQNILLPGQVKSSQFYLYSPKSQYSLKGLYRPFAVGQVIMMTPP